MSNQRRGPHDPSAWERSLQAERKELEIRQNGGLLKLIGFPLEGENWEELNAWPRR